jgi:hypothetical protein
LGRVSGGDMNVGDKIFDDIGEARIMSIAEGYAMVRRPRCMPFVIALKDIGKKWQPVQLDVEGDDQVFVCCNCSRIFTDMKWEVINATEPLARLKGGKGES